MSKMEELWNEFFKQNPSDKDLLDALVFVPLRREAARQELLKRDFTNEQLDYILEGALLKTEESWQELKKNPTDKQKELIAKLLEKPIKRLIEETINLS